LKKKSIEKKKTETIKERKIFASHGLLAGQSETSSIPSHPIPYYPRPRGKGKKGRNAEVDRPVSERCRLGA
jgi:hypothetical protein